MNEQEFRQHLHAQGYPDPEVLEREANLTNEQHTHDFSAAALVLAGEISVITETGTTTCRTGDMFALENGTPHHESYGPEGARFLLSRKA
jgi:quercetin dioxygenase-like cupin family protein